MMNCEYMEGCPIFNRFANEGSRNFWIKLYCRGTKLNSCERRRLRMGDQEVPITLLPNGKHLESLANR